MFRNRRHGREVSTALALILTATTHAQAATPREQAEAIVAKLTPTEKLLQLLNVAPAIPRLGIPRYNWWTESLHGAIGAVLTTNFPEPIGLGATFDTALVHNIAETVSIENRALHDRARATGRYGRIGTGLDTWSPNINIFRDPRWGRGQETYGEDPYLTARMGVAFVKGMQGPDPDHPRIIATPKHFAVHSGPEPTRHTVDVKVSPHDLEDTYLPAFRAAIVDGHAGSIMCAYNSVNGQPACANDVLLKRYLRGAWSFKGYVVSDCDAVIDISDHHHFTPDPASGVAVAVKAGVDNECNTQTLWDIGGLDRRYADALNRAFLTPVEIDTALGRLFEARLRTGDLPATRPYAPTDTAILAPDARELALRSAEEAMVLLKNDGRLPLASTARLLVVGPLADATRVLRGNYSSPLSGTPVSVLDGLRIALPQAVISYLPAPPSPTDGDPVPANALLTPDGKPGVRMDYFNLIGAPPITTSFEQMKAASSTMRFETRPILSKTEPFIADWAAAYPQATEHHHMVATGFLVPPASGSYRLAIAGGGGATFELDGNALAPAGGSGFDKPRFETVELVAGHRYPFRIVATSHALGDMQLLWKRVDANGLAKLTAAAADADAIVAVVGLTSDMEGEEMKVDLPGFNGGDRTSLDLPADQQKLLEAAAATGRPLVVVLMNGSPINLAWAKAHASAIVEAWYPGQSGGLAVGRVLAGTVNPAGRLPLTFYQSAADLPPFNDYSMANRTYRYFTGTPVYPFGYGLSYTRFAYLAPRVEKVGEGLRVTTSIRNVGPRAGDEVAQLYLNFPVAPGAPRVALRGFERLTLAPGETKTVTFDLSPRDLSSVDPTGTRRVAGGRYRVSVGGGQPDISVEGASTDVALVAGSVLPL